MVAQIGLSLLLLITAGLLVRSLSNLGDVNPGFDVHHLLSFSIGSPKQNGYTTEGAKLLYEQATRELGALPGVQSAALCVVAPLTFDQWENSLTVEGYVSKPAKIRFPG